MSASQEPRDEPARQERAEQQQQQQQQRQRPSASPAPEDDESDAGKYILFQRSEDDADPREHHVIPKSPDELRRRTASMRGGRGGRPAARRERPPVPSGTPPWGSAEGRGGEGRAAPVAVSAGGGGGEGGNVITPAVEGRLPRPSRIHPGMFRYPPSSPIKASPPSKSPESDEARPHFAPDYFEEAGDEWIPPPNKTARVRPSARDAVKTARDAAAPIRFPGEGHPPSVRPQFVREPTRGGSGATPPRRRPSLVVDASTSHDSAETPGRSLAGRVQALGAESSVAAEAGGWSLVSHSRSIESGEEGSWGAGPPTNSEGPTDGRWRHPPGTPGHPPYPPGEGYRPPPPHAPGYARYGPPGYPPDRYEEGMWSPAHPPRRHEYGYGSRCPHPPPPRRPPHRHLCPEEGEGEAAEQVHPLLKDYNPDNDGIRPQFQNARRTPRFVADPASAGGTGPSPRRRRRRNPEEKLASAAAMAAAAAAAAARAKLKKAGEDEVEDEEDEIKTVGSVEDEDIPAAKRAAMASAVALRAAAGGSPLAPPKAAAEVDFDIADPPLEPVHPPSTTSILDSASQMSENDVLCGRGGGTNSQMGNRRYRALVRDFQPTYLMARRREKPLMARSVVLIVRKRGGRFLRRDDSDGRLYEVGDEKAEAKTSQALREGLDVRATKTAANTLMGTETSKKRKRTSGSPVAVATTAPVPKFETPAKPPAKPFEGQKGGGPPTHPPYYAPPDRPSSHGPSHHHPYPPPPRYDDAYYRSYPPHYPPGAPGYHYPYPPPPGYGHYGAYPTPPGITGSGEHPPPPGSHPREPNPFSPPRPSARNNPPLTPVRSRKEGESRL